MTLAGRVHECAQLEQLLDQAREGRTAALVIRAAAGIGKTALLDYLSERADGYQVIRTRGLLSEADLPYAGLHRLCAPLVDQLERLPATHRAALDAAIGLAPDDTPDRLLVGHAALTLITQTATVRPLLCLVDDLHLIDDSTAQVLAFVVRRLSGHRVAFVFAERTDADRSEFEDVPELRLGGIPSDAARALLGAVLPGRLDSPIADRIVAEAHGVPRRLVAFSKSTSVASLGGGFRVVLDRQPHRRDDKEIRRRVASLPPKARLLLVAAAAEPVGDPILLWRAVAHLAASSDDLELLLATGLLTVDERVLFSDPLLRPLVYQSATRSERRLAHQALADATSQESDPDRWVWHVSQASDAPADDVAAKLEQASERVQTRGGLAAAAAFLEQAALLTSSPGERARRALEAATAYAGAGSFDAAGRLLVAAEHAPLHEATLPRAGWLRAQIRFALSRDANAALRLVDFADNWELRDRGCARQSLLEAFRASTWVGGGSIFPGRKRSSRMGTPSRTSPSEAFHDELLGGLQRRFADGYPAATESLTRALHSIGLSPHTYGSSERWLACRVAADLWDLQAWYRLAQADVSADEATGELAAVPGALAHVAEVNMHCGNLEQASRLLDESNSVAASMGTPRATFTELLLGGLRGNERNNLEGIASAREDAQCRGEALTRVGADLAAAVLYNGLGRYGDALSAAQRAAEHDQLGLIGWCLVELVEAASRTGEGAVGQSALTKLSKGARSSQTEWALGMDARSRALLSSDAEAEQLYVEAIDHLQRSTAVLHLARARLIYGEWLRRQGRRTDARVPLRAARDDFVAMGASAFADRAQRELRATGEKARKRTAGTCTQLTPQESRIALLARDGLTNPEIGTRLFVSPRTVEYHLHKVFGKLGITSRTELHLVLPAANELPKSRVRGISQGDRRDAPRHEAAPRGVLSARFDSRPRAYGIAETSMPTAEAS